MAAVQSFFFFLALVLIVAQAQVPNRMIMCDTEADVARCNIYCSRQQENGYGVCDYGVCHCYPGPQRPQVITTTTTETIPSVNDTSQEDLGTRIQIPVLGAVAINIRCNTRSVSNHPLYCPFWCVNTGFYDGFCAKNRVCNCWQSPYQMHGDILV